MTRKDIYVFKAKFGVGNFEIEVYKLPVKKETAKAYFVDDHDRLSYWDNIENLMEDYPKK